MFIGAAHHILWQNILDTQGHASYTDGNEKQVLINNALKQNPIPIYGDGKNIRDWLYVLDHCKGIDLVYHNGKTGQTYNIGGRNERTNLQIVDRICEILDKEVPLGTGTSVPA